MFEDWDEQAGERMTELVFIGSEMDKEGITASLDACLVTEGGSGTGYFFFCG